MKKKYWAFVSYSSTDKKWGKWLHRRLESYPVPKEFQGKEIFDGDPLGKNLRPCFRDRDELPGAAELGPAILKALNNSRFLVVLCSKNSAQSTWVNKEITDFQAINPENEKCILALILDGEPNATSNEKFPDSEECFPPALRAPHEPLAGDLRKNGDGKQRGFLKILAGIFQLDFDVLYRRHERSMRKRRIVWGTVAALVIAALTGLSFFAIKKTREQSALLDNVALADHDSALHSFDLKQYRESAAYYARSLSIRPSNNTIALSAVSSALMADTLFAKQRHIVKLEGSVGSLHLSSDRQQLHIQTTSGPQTLSLIDGQITVSTSAKNSTELAMSNLAEILTSHPWLKESVSSISTATISPDRTTIFAGTKKGKIHKFSLPDQGELWMNAPQQRKNHITHIALSPCGQTLAVSDWDSSLSLVDAETGKVLDEIIFDHNIDHLNYTPDGYFLIATTENGYLRVFNTGSSPALIKTSLPNTPKSAKSKLPGFRYEKGKLHIEKLGLDTPFALSHKPDIVCVSPNNLHVIAGSNDGRLTNTNLSGKSFTTRRKGAITDIAISRDNSTYFVASKDRNIIAYEMASGNEKWRQSFKGFVNEISLSQKDTFLAAASDDFTFRIFDASTGKTVWTSLLDGCVESISFLPDQPNLIRCATSKHEFTLDCGHLFKQLTDDRGELSAFLVQHAAKQLHELAPKTKRHQPDGPANIKTILEWKLTHPLQQTRSPFSTDLISHIVSDGLTKGAIPDIDQYHRLAPWHPLTPVSLARNSHNANNKQRQAYLCKLTLERLKNTDPHHWDTKKLAADAIFAAKWMQELGHPELSQQASDLTKSIPNK